MDSVYEYVDLRAKPIKMICDKIALDQGQRKTPTSKETYNSWFHFSSMEENIGFFLSFFIFLLFFAIVIVKG